MPKKHSAKTFTEHDRRLLHNVCERAGEELDPDLMQYELDDDDCDVVIAHDVVPSAPAVQSVRDRIAHGVLHGRHASN